MTVSAIGFEGFEKRLEISFVLRQKKLEVFESIDTSVNLFVFYRTNCIFVLIKLLLCLYTKQFQGET